MHCTAGVRQTCIGKSRKVHNLSQRSTAINVAIYKRYQMIPGVIFLSVGLSGQYLESMARRVARGMRLHSCAKTEIGLLFMAGVCFDLWRGNQNCTHPRHFFRDSQRRVYLLFSRKNTPPQDQAKCTPTSDFILDSNATDAKST